MEEADPKQLQWVTEGWIVPIIIREDCVKVPPSYIKHIDHLLKEWTKNKIDQSCDFISSCFICSSGFTKTEKFALFFLDISKDSGGQLDLLIVDALYKVSLMQSLTLGFVNHLL